MKPAGHLRETRPGQPVDRRRPRRPSGRSLLRVLVVATLAAQFLLPAAWVETVWFRFVFRPLARVLVPVSSAVPISLTEILAVVCVLVLIGWTRRRWLDATASVRWRRLFSALGPLGWMALVAYLSFAWVWGFNYARPPIEQRADLAGPEPSREEFDRLIDQTVTRVNELVAAAHRADLPQAESRARGRLSKVVEQIDRVTPTLPPRAKRVFPSGLLSTFGAVGVTSPWLLEAHIDPDILSIEQPFTAAHEIAHVAGFAPEGDASFVAYLACRDSGNPLAEYSARLAILRQLLRRLGPVGRKAVTDRLEAVVRQDLAGIRKRVLESRWEPAARVQSAVYDGYLRTQKVTLGLADYGRVIELIIRWNRLRPP